MNPLLDFEDQTPAPGGLLAGLNDAEKLAAMAASGVEDRRPFMPRARAPDTESARGLLMLRGLDRHADAAYPVQNVLNDVNIESRKQMANPTASSGMAYGLADPVALRAMRLALRPDLGQFNRPQVISPRVRTDEAGDTIITRGLMGLRR